MTAAHPELPWLIASGHSYAQIARNLGVRRQTVAGWAQQPDVSAAVDAIRRELAEETAARVKTMATLALDTLLDLLTARGTPHAVRRRAAVDILDRVGLPAAQRLDVTGLAQASESDLRARLRALEAAAARLELGDDDEAWGVAADADVDDDTDHDADTE